MADAINLAVEWQPPEVSKTRKLFKTLGKKHHAVVTQPNKETTSIIHLVIVVAVVVPLSSVPFNSLYFKSR